LDERLATNGVPGAALGVVTGNRLFTHAYGVAEVSSAEPVSPATPFRIASLTKVFTAAAVARLAHVGQIEVQQPVRAILPEFGVADAETGAAVTTAHLLSHSTGWADALEPDPAHDRLGDYVDRMQDLPQVAPVGRYLSYSNSGYLLAGHLLATISGRDYEWVIRSEVIDPLGLPHTGFASEDRVFGPLARGHAVGDDGPVLIEAGVPPRSANPAFGLLSSVDDLLTFLHAHLKAAADSTSPFAGMVRALGDGGSVGPTVVDRVGMGWMLREVGGHQVAMSQGSDAGYCAGMAFAPADGFALAVLTNSDAALMLVNDALWQGVSLFVGATVPTPELAAPDPADIEAKSGTFALWDGMEFQVRAGNGGLALATRLVGESLPDLAGPLTMTGTDHGFLAALGGRVWFDFVRGDGGNVDWLRFAGRLAPRVG
jgi:CubicO group peptidase (beta-lactamase class C family)